MNRNWKDQLERHWNENPLAVIATSALALTAASKLIDAMSAAQGRRAYAKQVNHRVRRKNY